jgi:hypothetical protein
VQGRRAIGWIALVGGAILLLWGAIWGRSGYYASQAPILLLLVLGGGAIAVTGGLLLRKPKQEVRPVEWRRTDDRGQ